MMKIKQETRVWWHCACSGIAWKFRPQHYSVDGLNSLRYKLVDSEARPLYTWLLVKLPLHPNDQTYFSAGDTYHSSDAHSPSATHSEHLLCTLHSAAVAIVIVTHVVM